MFENYQAHVFSAKFFSMNSFDQWCKETQKNYSWGMTEQRICKNRLKYILWDKEGLRLFFFSK